MRKTLCVATLLFVACSSDPGAEDSGSVLAGASDGGVTDAGIADGGAADAGTTDAGTADAGTTFTLSINNYLAWCTLTENGAPYSSSKSFPSGAVVNLTGAPANGFVWGYWTGTDGAGSAHDVNTTATVTMTGNKSVLACCPFAPPASQTCP